MRCRATRTIYADNGSGNYITTLENCWQFLIKLNMYLAYEPAILLLGT